MSLTPLRYRIFAADPAAHHFEVSCTVPCPAAGGQRFALPAWIPGSYLIREFARHVIAIRAEAGGKPVRLDKLDKHTWQAAPVKNGTALTVTMTVYAWDLSVRGAHLDATHGFFNGTSVFLRVLGQEDAPCLVDLQPPAGREFKGWRVATSLPPARGERGERGAAKALGFGLYRAANYDELIDHPVEMGTFTHFSFEAGGVPHEVAITGRHDCDTERLAADLAKICTAQIDFFGRPAPMARYVFLVTAVGDGYGGLEHRASTALICKRADLPARGDAGISDGYRRFLGLCSHEYFHTWNVKRIKPAAFVPYDLERENYTPLLWAFEGFTSYYDDLFLLRSGVINRAGWLELLADTLGAVRKAPGRQLQSLAESSFDAWIKYYRPDENTPNAVVSYYAKGALFALALDLTLRAKTDGRVALDDVMRALWEKHGKTGVGVDEDDIREIAEGCSGLKLKRLFVEGVSGTRDLPLKKLLAPLGVDLSLETAPAAKTPSLGIKTNGDNGANEIRLATVFDGGAAQTAGLAAGDALLAVDGLRVTPTTLDQLLARHQPGDTVHIHAFRRDELMEFTVRLDPPPEDNARLAIREGAYPLRKQWLGG